MTRTRLLMRLPQRSFSFNHLIDDPSNERLHQLALAVNSLQTEPLTQIVRVEQQTL